MDLMSVNTTYSELEDKYGDFRAPTIDVVVGGTKLVKQGELNISEIEVELTTGYEASGCTFYVDGAYDAKQTDFTGNISKLQIGEVIEVELGYIQTENIFKGYINQIDYIFGIEENSYRIRVECIDLKGLLMKNRRMEFFEKKGIGEVVNTILGMRPAGNYRDGAEIDDLGEEAGEKGAFLGSSMMTDYDIILEQANKTGKEFFVVQGKVYFRNKTEAGGTIITLTPQNGILTARLTLSGQELFETAEIRGIDPANAKQISAKERIEGTFSAGSSAQKMMQESRQVFYEPGIQSIADAQKRAKVRVEKAAESFGLLECVCVGIPEIGPGRWFEVKGLSKEMDGRYYIVNVVHNIDSDGFRTTIKARMKSL